MNKIKQLPDEIVSKIAAGEVIERPAYAVKELIENALDAGATSTKIEIEESGLKKIVITDNGSGMSKSDLLASFLPHTTSKITQISDLDRIKSLGFRGEALSSIAAISDITINSKTDKDKVGTSIKISSSKLKKQGKIGMPTGTQIIVENLFSHVPARKKFLKSERTEYRHILDIITYFTLSYPTVAFEFSHNKKQIFHFTSADSQQDRIKKLFGETIYSHLLPFRFNDSYIALNGFLSRPQITSSTSQKILIFVNNRKIVDSLIVSAVRDAYASLLDHSSYPYAILFLSVPHQLVDVNVHPRKEIVKFIDPQGVYSTVTKAFSETLKNNNLTFFNLSWKTRSTHSPAAQLLKKLVLDSDIASIGKVKSSSAVIQVHNLYLVAETKGGIIFIDQHAAHEAVLYRHFVNAYKHEKKKTKKLQLQKSFLINLSISDMEILQENIDLFNQIGFDFEEFGEKAIKVNAIPILLKDLDAGLAIEEMISDIREEKLPKEVDKRTNKMLSYLACRSAIKAGQKISQSDMKKLIKSLQKEDYVYTCPHGRPVKIEFSLKEFDLLFKRR